MMILIEVSYTINSLKPSELSLPYQIERLHSNFMVVSFIFIFFSSNFDKQSVTNTKVAKYFMFNLGLSPLSMHFKKDALPIKVYIACKLSLL